MLGDGPSVIRNAPEVGEVGITAAMLRSPRHRRSSVTATRSPSAAGPSTDPHVPEAFTGLNRIPILMLGPLLHRAGEAFVPLVGGDPIGRRPVDFHVERAAGHRRRGRDRRGRHPRARPAGCAAPGSSCPTRASAPPRRCCWPRCWPRARPSSRNAATEPEVIELALFLQRMGARIELQPGPPHRHRGRRPRSPAPRTRLAGDRIEAFSYLVAGLVTGGEVRVHGCPQDRLVTAITTLDRMGARFEITDEWIIGVRAGRAARRGGPDRHPPRVHDRLADAAHGAVHPGRRACRCCTRRCSRTASSTCPRCRRWAAEIEVFDACLGGPAAASTTPTRSHSAVVRGRDQAARRPT